jgi:transaldolase
VESLIASETVDTLPPATLEAYRDHGRPEVRIDAGIATAPGHLMALAETGIELGRVTDELEDEGVRKFADSYDALLAEIETKAGALKAAGRG